MAENSGTQPPKPPLVEIIGDLEIKSSDSKVLEVGPDPKDTERIPLTEIDIAQAQVRKADKNPATIPVPKMEKAISKQAVGASSGTADASGHSTTNSLKDLLLNNSKPPFRK